MMNAWNTVEMSSLSDIKLPEKNYKLINISGMNVNKI